MLADSFGRVATDLRVSLTDRCNLRCSYCMPAEGLDWLPNPSLLTDDEVVRLIAIVMEKLMGTSGAESLNVAASLFMGQTEAPLTIRPLRCRPGLPFSSGQYVSYCLPIDPVLSGEILAGSRA